MHNQQLKPRDRLPCIHRLTSCKESAWAVQLRRKERPIVGGCRGLSSTYWRALGHVGPGRSCAQRSDVARSSSCPPGGESEGCGQHRSSLVVDSNKNIRRTRNEVEGNAGRNEKVSSGAGFALVCCVWLRVGADARPRPSSCGYATACRRLQLDYPYQWHLRKVPARQDSSLGSPQVV